MMPNWYCHSGKKNRDTFQYFVLILVKKHLRHRFFNIFRKFLLINLHFRVFFTGPHRLVIVVYFKQCLFKYCIQLYIFNNVLLYINDFEKRKAECYLYKMFFNIPHFAVEFGQLN